MSAKKILLFAGATAAIYFLSKQMKNGQLIEETATFEPVKHTGSLLGKIEVDKTFLGNFVLPFEMKAATLGVKILPVSSFRYDANVQNAVVTPAKMSNHMVGHALDLNFVYGGKTYKNKDLIKFDSLPSAIRSLIEFSRSIGRWGGDFSTPDGVHFDDGLNINHPDLWQAKYKQIHA